MHDVSAVLLAAGESTRMGRQKALLPWRGTTLLDYQVSGLLEAGVSKIVTVLGYRAETLRSSLQGIPGVVTVLNLRYRTGKVSSIRAGLRQVSSESTAILVISVDQPRSALLIRRTIQAHNEQGVLITYPVYGDRGGHPIIFSATLLPEMVRIRESRYGLREVVERHRKRALRLEIGDPDVLLDLNRQDDYQRAISHSVPAR